MQANSDIVSQNQREERYLPTQINAYINNPCTGIGLEICLLDPDLEVLGYVFKGRLFEPAFRISTTKWWAELSQEYRHLCTVRCIPLDYQQTIEKGTYLHPFMFYGQIIKVIEDILGEHCDI